MSTDVRVPALPESVADATVLTWHKQPGDIVVRDENLVDLETDKVVLEVPAPTDGVLGAISAVEGDTVQADELLTVIVAASASATPAVVSAKAEPAEETSQDSDSNADGEPVLTPSVRKLVKELGIDASDIKGTGKHGRILKSDVMAHLDKQESKRSVPAATNKAAAVLAPVGARPEQRVPMTRLRARIAERLIEAQSTAAILTTFNEVNLQVIMDIRKQHQDAFVKAHDIKLGFMSFFVKATIEALKKFPAVNASIDGNDVIYHGYYDIGVAVGSPRGLVVPVLRDADQMSLAGIENKIKEFGQRAADGSLTYEELNGGTFTISNGGVFGSMLSTPILNPPQSGILGMHNIIQRPIAENGEVVIRPMMYLAHSYDHRIIDGREAVQFLVSIKEALEDPARMLLDI
jgi:2-oxoglutarate dehydrogenase E2 component (dihydrolipoamide succinyltransferase)